MPLLLRCTLCPRTQADGLLSRAAWGFVLLSDGRTLQVCPSCKTPGWDERVRAVANGSHAGDATRRHRPA
jgi:hypothetical protein